MDIHFIGSPTVATGSVDHREIKMLVLRSQRDQKIEHLVDDLVGAGIRSITFVDDHDQRMIKFERLAKHEPGLRHRAFESIDEQKHSVSHLQNSLDFTTEIGVTRRVDDVDTKDAGMGALRRRSPGDRAVLGRDGDPTLFFQRIGIKDTIGFITVERHRPAVGEQRVDEGRLAMVDMRDDCDVTEIRIGDRGG